MIVSFGLLVLANLVQLGKLKSFLRFLYLQDDRDLIPYDSMRWVFWFFFVCLRRCVLCVFWYVDFQGKMVCFVIDFLDVFDYFVDVRV